MQPTSVYAYTECYNHVVKYLCYLCKHVVGCACIGNIQGIYHMDLAFDVKQWRTESPNGLKLSQTFKSRLNKIMVITVGSCLAGYDNNQIINKCWYFCEFLPFLLFHALVHFALNEG